MVRTGVYHPSGVAARAGARSAPRTPAPGSRSSGIPEVSLPEAGFRVSRQPQAGGRAHGEDRGTSARPGRTRQPSFGEADLRRCARRGRGGAARWVGLWCAGAGRLPPPTPHPLVSCYVASAVNLGSAGFILACVWLTSKQDPEGLRLVPP